MLPENGLKGLRRGIPKSICVNHARKEVWWEVGKDPMILVAPRMQRDFKNEMKAIKLAY